MWVGLGFEKVTHDQNCGRFRLCFRTVTRRNALSCKRDVRKSRSLASYDALTTGDLSTALFCNNGYASADASETTPSDKTGKRSALKSAVSHCNGNIACRGWLACGRLASPGGRSTGVSWPGRRLVDVCVRLICSISRLVVSHTVGPGVASSPPVRLRRRRCRTSLPSRPASRHRPRKRTLPHCSPMADLDGLVGLLLFNGTFSTNRLYRAIEVQ